MAELVDATDLKSVDLLIVRVRFPLSVFVKGHRVMAFTRRFRTLNRAGASGVCPRLAESGADTLLIRGRQEQMVDGGTIFRSDLS